MASTTATHGQGVQAPPRCPTCRTPATRETRDIGVGLTYGPWLFPCAAQVDHPEPTTRKD